MTRTIDPARAGASSLGRLAIQLHDVCDAQPFHTGWFLKAVATGEIVRRHGDVVVPAASTRKVAILMAALRAVHEGRLGLDQPCRIEARYQDNRSGVFQFLRPGFTITLEDALQLMIIVSDNTCTGIVTDLVGLPAVNALSRAVGMVATAHLHGNPPPLPRDHPVAAVNTTTPDDAGLLLDLILQATTREEAAARLGASPELCRLAVTILSRQRLRGGLPALLPNETVVANKTGVGWGYRNFNDVGIVFDDGRPLFILAAYTEHVPLELADGTPGRAAALGLIARLSRACYDALRDGAGRPPNGLA